MVINTNSQSAITASNRNATAPKPAARPLAESIDVPAVDVAISTRNSLESAEIASEDEAFRTTDFARSHILTHPTSAVAVQANARPEAVFELLQGLLV